MLEEGKKSTSLPDIWRGVYLTPSSIKPGIEHIKVCKTGHFTPWGGFARRFCLRGSGFACAAR
jgi:hypothetical protein